MIINISKFGSVLTSRQAGREALAAFSPVLASVSETENIVVDFDGVSTFTPSWGDEFLTPIQKKFGTRLTVKNTSNPSVNLTLSTLERINESKFIKE